MFPMYIIVSGKLTCPNLCEKLALDYMKPRNHENISIAIDYMKYETTTTAATAEVEIVPISTISETRTIQFMIVSNIIKTKLSNENIMASSVSTAHSVHTWANLEA